MKRNICIVIPCYRVRHKILSVYNKIDFKVVDKVIIVDDCCPEKSGRFLKKILKKTIKLNLFSKRNLGVGGATLKGFKKAYDDNYKTIIKIDSDGQHETKFIKKFYNFLLIIMIFAKVIEI